MRVAAIQRRHGALLGGSFLCRDADGEVRNAFLVATPDGEIAGRHDKDLPTMWENALYVGGDDGGVIEADGITVGAAVCWELMRTQTVRRLRGRVDLALTGSGWWSMSSNWPGQPLRRRLERANHERARRAAETFALYVGAPVVHAAHAGPLECEMPWLPLPYRGRFEGGAIVTDAEGRLLARRDRGAIAAFAWNYQRLHGRPRYRRHVAGRPAREVRRPAAE